MLEFPCDGSQNGSVNQISMSYGILVFPKERKMITNLKDSVIETMENHSLWLVQKCGISRKYHDGIAAHLYRLCHFIGLIPGTVSHNSPILQIDKSDNREYLVDFGVNRYLLTAVLDYALRHKAVKDRLARQFQYCLPNLVRGSWSRIWKTVPTAYHVDHCCANALELMFGGNSSFRPFIPSGELVAHDKYKQMYRSETQYREFYSPDLNATFYSTESTATDWADSMEWRFITQHPSGFPMLGKGRGRCLPRLAVNMAVKQFVRMELGNVQNWEDELVPEMRQSLLSRDNHQDLGEFPWEAFFQSEFCKNPDRAREIIHAESVIMTGSVDKARYCMMNTDQYKMAKSRLMDDAKVWFDEVGVDLD